MPNRIIKESIRTSKSVNSMSDFQFRLWTYLITYADDYGRGSADAEILKGFLFPRRKRVTETDIAKGLNDLAGMGCILLYEIDGESYFCFPNWADHQRIRNCKEKFPAPPDNLPQVAASCGELPPRAHVYENPIQSESESNPNTNARSASAPTRHKYGEYQNVLLSDEDLEKLKEEFPNDWAKRIERLSEYISSTGKSYKNHLATIRSWAKRDKPGEKQQRSSRQAKSWDDLPDGIF